MQIRKQFLEQYQYNIARKLNKSNKYIFNRQCKEANYLIY